MADKNQATQDLLRLWEFLKWVDDARWNWERKQGIKRLLNYINEAQEICGCSPINNFEPRHLVLSHWLTYIFDYQTSVDTIWKNCFPVMARIVKEFQEGCSAEEVINKYKKQETKDNKIATYFSIEADVTCKHRFTTSHKLDRKIERTIKVLEYEFNKDLIELMLKITGYGEENDWIRKVGCALYLLTYDTSKSEKEVIDILTHKKKFEKYYLRRNDKLYHKRLWSAFEDYLKGCTHQYIVSSLGKYRQHNSSALNRWRNPQKYFNQLEVPGDRWNKRFYKKIVEPIISKLNIKIYDDDNISRNIRHIYNYICNNCEKFDSHSFYPEQFDVTFDFAQIFCNRNLCYICPLHRKNEIKKLCIGDNVANSGNKKYCPILTVLGYLQPCHPDSCPVYRGETFNLCNSKL